jgi:hypothetical protein
VLLTIARGDEAASMHQQLAMMPNGFELAGMPAAQTEPEPAGDGLVSSMLGLLPNESTGVFLGVVVPEDIDAAAAARSIAELIAPRLADYLGG